MNVEVAKQIAHSLLKIGAVKLSPTNPFTWVSGWKSPIYCDNRCTLGDVQVREQICEAFVNLIRSKYPDVEVIAGVATGAIAHGMLVAERLKLPFAYVRAERKEHGLKKVVEGANPEGKKVVVIEDLVSTGKSSASALVHLKEEQANVLGMAAIFTYEFDEARKKFEELGVDLITLSGYTALVEQALEDGYIHLRDVEALKKWRSEPDKFLK
ncbi:MAG: orotate phosphoribosyltransferase [Prevotellaceae bacterium]|jgi:orotate phosphoribosyltransferase|nr:orotate phosphoribosyltransferase [Prevotellaceae bacterium]